MSFSSQTGLDWGGEYSRWNFDESKAYQMVAKMQREPGTSNGIPLLDSELNENSEILLTLIRRLIYRIHGDGSMGDGFKIVASNSSPNNNFTIMGGDGTSAGAGYLFVNGWMPINLTNLEYTDQSYGPDSLTTPSADRTDEVYIDVYYEEVSYETDSAIKDTDIDLETSRRIGLVWEIKVAEDSTTPSSYVDGNNIQHWCYRLAILNRFSGDSSIDSDMIVDVRHSARLIKREYLHNQGTAYDSWSIAHYLGSQNLIIKVSDDAGNEMEPGITYNDDNNITLDFNGNSVTGTALLLAVDGQ